MRARASNSPGPAVSDTPAARFGSPLGRSGATLPGNSGSARPQLIFGRAEEPPLPSRNYVGMNRTKSLVGTLLIVALSAGCASSTSPNTQRGALGGAAAGAVIGGIIGNNRSGETTKGAAIGAAAGGIAGAAIGNSADRRAENNATSADRGYSQQGYVFQQPPPAPTSAPYESMPPRPNRDAVWIPGYYDYTGQGDQYRWVHGHWENPPQGYRNWVPPTWQPTNGGYVYVRGQWQ